jgi:hypothetical protein
MRKKGKQEAHERVKEMEAVIWKDRQDREELDKE